MKIQEVADDVFAVQRHLVMKRGEQRAPPPPSRHDSLWELDEVFDAMQESPDYEPGDEEDIEQWAERKHTSVDPAQSLQTWGETPQRGSYSVITSGDRSRKDRTQLVRTRRLSTTSVSYLLRSLWQQPRYRRWTQTTSLAAMTATIICTEHLRRRNELAYRTRVQTSMGSKQGHGQDT